MIKYTSSMIVAKARGLEADGIPSVKSGNCAFCGHEINEGDLQVPFAVSGSFMDDLSLASKGSDMTCGWCVHHITAEGLRETGYGVFSIEHGAKPFRKWVDVREALLNPPTGPFVMVYATANNQHMAWRAPVNFSTEMFYVRVGLRDLKIRRKKLIQAVDVCREVALAMGRKEVEGKTLPNPYDSLSPDLKDVNHAGLTHAMRVWKRKGFEHLENDEKYISGIRFLQGLTLGETWALRFVLSPNAGKN